MADCLGGYLLGIGIIAMAGSVVYIAARPLVIVGICTVIVFFFNVIKFITDIFVTVGCPFPVAGVLGSLNFSVLFFRPPVPAFLGFAV